MSRFYGTVQGQAKTQASRRGSGTTGISGHIRGWDIGIKIVSQPLVNDKKDYDCFSIYVTGGSNGGKQTHKIATVYLPIDGSEERTVWARINRDGQKEISYTLPN